MTSSSVVLPGPGNSPGRRLLLLVFGATFLSRAVAGAVSESLRAELWLTDQALGTLASAFAGAYALALPVGAAAGGRGRRGGWVALALALCGGATAASAAAHGFWPLIAARVAAGAGAGLAAGAGLVALLGGGDPPARARGLFLPATAGLALGYVLGGACGRMPGWRGAFILTGAALLALAAACLRGLQGPDRAESSRWSLRALRQAQADRGEGGWRAVRRLATDRTRILPVIAAVAGASAASALAFWLPSFLARTRGVPRMVAGAQLGVAVLAAGFAGAALARAASLRPGAGPATGAWTAAAGTAVAALGMAAALAVAAPAIVLPAVMVALLGAAAAVRGAVSAFRGPSSDPALVAFALLLVHGAGELGGALGLGAVADRVSFGRALYLLPAALAATAALWAGTALAVQGRARRAPEESSRELA